MQGALNERDDLIQVSKAPGRCGRAPFLFGLNLALASLRRHGFLEDTSHLGGVLGLADAGAADHDVGAGGHDLRHYSR